ncbi:monovalent cation/H+ antiporter complex subunit F [Alkalimonas collagenimarina]|uniref:Monovalent cation/H+ antiporter complex subunit F n=2 Tax=Alkalimonas collagenimarina TaxID=400390 RepID=A0ABT9GYT6_9GAMM|nr:monovalent cation/H+ antiporter complex subunit F [Alkalimonas collagenimarina]MDP4536221.1 monovalent cation/H+ antiporter complex subunit F [Alkalimonas collagenimarina]
MWLACLLLLTVLLGLWRVWRGPDLVNRLLAIQLLGSGGVAVLLVLSLAFSDTALLEVALVLALLAAVVPAAFVHRLKREHK